MDQIIAARHDAAAVRRFRRAMRRHVRRAASVSDPHASQLLFAARGLALRDARQTGIVLLAVGEHAAGARLSRHRTAAFLYDRAADAVAKLRAALSADV